MVKFLSLFSFYLIPELFRNHLHDQTSYHVMALNPEEHRNVVEKRGGEPSGNLARLPFGHDINSISMEDF